MSAWQQPEPSQWWVTVEDALDEDIGNGDLTVGCLPPELVCKWRIDVQADAVLCGVGIAEHLLAPAPEDPYECDIEVFYGDGERVKKGTTILAGTAIAKHTLSNERTALNFLMRLSGIATLTHHYVERVSDTSAKIVDTRKTTPLLRNLEKYAVRCGGGHNHRMGLYDGAMLKDNHIAAVGSISKAVQAIRRYASHMSKVEVECTTLAQVDEAVRAGADIVMLDNMDPFTMREAVKKYKGQTVFEASGGITLETVHAVAMTGVDLISVGALTHSAPAVPFHLEFSA